MGGMAQTPAHAKPARRDHLWVLAVIAGFALYDVWESWTQVGNKSGFAHGTGWTLTVIVEAYAGYALFAWFNAPGRRSRRFAMWSAFAVLALSLVGQGASVLAAHAMPPLWLAVFVKDLPVVTLALIAVLVHLRRLDREDEREAGRQAAAETAEVSELTALSAELEALRDAHGGELETLMSDLEAARNARADAEQCTAEALTRAETAEKKLAAKTAQAKRSRTTQGDAKTAQDEDLTTELRALKLLDEDPSLRGPRMGGELGRRLGVSAPTGRRLHARLTAQDRLADPLSERSPGTEDERSGERS